MKKIYPLLFIGLLGWACNKKQSIVDSSSPTEKAGLTTNNINVPFLDHSVQYAFYSNEQKTMIFSQPLIDLSSNVSHTGSTISGNRIIDCLDENYNVLTTASATFTSAGKFVLPQACQKDWFGSLADGVNGTLYSYFKIQGLIPLFTAVTKVKPEFTYSNNPGFRGKNLQIGNQNTSTLQVNLIKQMPNSQIDAADDYTFHFQVAYNQLGTDFVTDFGIPPITVSGAQLIGNDTTTITLNTPDLIIYQTPIKLNFKSYLLKKLDASSTLNKTIAIDTFSISLVDPNSMCLISTWQDLKNMGTNHQNVTDTCYLQNNIDLSAAGNWSPINGFKGVFDGQDYTLSNLSYNSNTVNGVGLFGTLTGTATNKIIIKNLQLTNASITTTKNRVGVLGGFFTYVNMSNVKVSNSNIIGNSDVGGIVGRLSNGSMSAVHHGTGTITANGNNAGGLIGYALNATNTDKGYALQNITISNSNSGGLIGSIESGSSVSNSYATGDVTSDDDFVGGLIGSCLNSSASTSYAKGEVVSNGGGIYLGGLIGNATSCTISNSYFPQGVNHPNNGFGTELTSAQVLVQANFVGFNFTNIWNWVGGGNFPTLQ